MLIYELTLDTLCSFFFILSHFLLTRQNHLPDTHAKFHVLFLFFVAAMFFISILSLFSYHLWLVGKNRTTIGKRLVLPAAFSSSSFLYTFSSSSSSLFPLHSFSSPSSAAFSPSLPLLLLLLLILHLFFLFHVFSSPFPFFLFSSSLAIQLLLLTSPYHKRFNVCLFIALPLFYFFRFTANTKYSYCFF